MTREEILKTYRICIEWLDDDRHWLAWLPDFGHSACSYADETLTATLHGLGGVAVAIVEYYKKKGKTLPTPTKLPKIG